MQWALNVWPPLVNSPRVTPRAVDLRACLDAFHHPELLDHDNSYRCSACKQDVFADKRLSFRTLPDTLVIHLKRFAYSRANSNKLNTPVAFPLEGLDLGSYVEADTSAKSSSSGDVLDTPGAHRNAATDVSMEEVEAEEEARHGGGQRDAASRGLPSGVTSSASLTSDYLYDLIGVSNHSGSMSYGHYTAYCRMPDDNLWYEFDD